MSQTTTTWQQPTIAQAVIEIVVTEDLDVASTDRLGETLEDALSMRPRRLIVDLSRCPFADASAMSVLVKVHRQARQRETLLQLRAPNARVLRVLTLTGLDRVFDIVPAGDGV